MNNRIVSTNFEDKFAVSYLNYAVSVIVSRALPDIRDGLKPVHRRILYAMYRGGYLPNRGFVKCARVVGDVMGNYHPHGDTSIYDALARLTQDWNMRIPLIKGNGNFGSRGDDDPAAMRYTECKLDKISLYLLSEIDENVVDFVPNYDSRLKEPVILPARFPNLLVNGATGIAVGMSTNIPTHNLGEVLDAVGWYIKYGLQLDNESILKGLLNYIKGPDFSTAGILLDDDNIANIYRTGHGAIAIRGKIEVQESSQNTQLIIKEIPYQVNTDRLVSHISSLANNNIIENIREVRDESSIVTGIKLVIVLKKYANPDVVLKLLYKHTALQDMFHVNMLTVIDKHPRVISLVDYIKLWVDYQIEIIVKRTQYRLERAQNRAHILSGYIKAIDAIDAVIGIIRNSKDSNEANGKLCFYLKVDTIQASAILALQLKSLAALEKQKIVDEFNELLKTINELKEILGSYSKQMDILYQEIEQINKQFRTPRLTQIQKVDSHKISLEDLVVKKDVLLTISKSGYLKITDIESYRLQNRGGKGARGVELNKDDVLSDFIVTSNYDYVLLFTNYGRMYHKRVYEFGESNKISKGKHLSRYFDFQSGESITRVMTTRDYKDAKYIVMVTAYGYLKKMRLSSLNSHKQNLIVTNLEDGDKLVAVDLCNDNSNIVVINSSGKIVKFKEDNLRIMETRNTRGVKSMKLDNNYVINMHVVDDDQSQYLITITEHGLAKKTLLSDYRTYANRGAQGVSVSKITKSTGAVVASVVAGKDDEILAITNNSGIIRTHVNDIRSTSRVTQGSRLIKVDNYAKVIGLTLYHEPDVELSE